MLQKGVYVFNLVQSKENPKEFILYGAKKDNYGFVRNKLKKGIYQSTCTQLLRIRWDGEELHFDPLPEWDSHYKRVKFEYLSIHQGLLDKLYGTFGISKKDTGKREILTRDLFLIFKDSDIIPFDEGKKFFLPGMCIHSGRSKPEKDDMPQHLPFIQYSAIEHAVQDCKYSLVELLDFARYQDE